MKHRNTRRYAVKTSIAKHATIISSHCTLGEAYKSFIKHHKAHFKLRRFPMSQEPIAIIVTESPTEIIHQDIHAWATYGKGPPSKRRLPMPIIVHRWDNQSKTYIKHGTST